MAVAFTPKMQEEVERRYAQRYGDEAFPPDFLFGPDKSGAEENKFDHQYILALAGKRFNHYAAHSHENNEGTWYYRVSGVLKLVDWARCVESVAKEHEKKLPFVMRKDPEIDGSSLSPHERERFERVKAEMKRQSQGMQSPGIDR